MSAAQNGVTGPIRYAVGTIAISRVFLALTERGVCALHLLDNDEERALESLRLRYPRASLVADRAAIEPFLAKINAWLSDESEEVPLDLCGTPFQLRVWRELQRVPRGETWSYSQLAERVGNPRAVRAVASACARNPVVLVIPCHRIVRSDGSLGGYGCRPERKQALLDAERRLD